MKAQIMNSTKLVKEMYIAILANDLETQKKLHREMLQYNLMIHKNNQKITAKETVFVG